MCYQCLLTMFVFNVCVCVQTLYSFAYIIFNNSYHLDDKLMHNHASIYISLHQTNVNVDGNN